VSDPVPSLLAIAAALVLGVGLLASRALRLPSGSPDRLVAELRLAQVASLVLALAAGASLGLVAAQRGSGASFEAPLAMAFFLAASIAPFRDPREALTLLAAAFAAHAVADVLHRPGFLPHDLAPGWFSVGCAIHNLVTGVLCYLPVLRR
jgi:hypothetical protein